MLPTMRDVPLTVKSSFLFAIPLKILNINMEKLTLINRRHKFIVLSNHIIFVLFNVKNESEF